MIGVRWKPARRRRPVQNPPQFSIPQPAAIWVIIPLPPRSPQSLDTPRAERAEAGRDVERARAEALHTTIDELKAGQALMTEMHARELAVAQHDAQVTEELAAELRRAEAERRGRGLLTRLRAAWRGD